MNFRKAFSLCSVLYNYANIMQNIQKWKHVRKRRT
nr:MAG TPA: hypothetical protein [Bacteriophage sp.]